MHAPRAPSDDLAAWLDFQQRQHPRSIELGLARVREVALRMGLLPLPCASIIVGGTNGKGSTVAHLAALAQAAGLTTVAFTSPHLLRYNERISIDGRAARDSELIGAFERIEAARAGTPLTFFEYNALAALDLVVRTAPDLAILEVGLGGRLDATNTVDADVAVLCSIGMDHADYLGDTLEQIGREKVGIVRNGRPVILGTADMPASVTTGIEAAGAQARWRGRDFELTRGWSWDFPALPPSALAGTQQGANAASAIAALVALAETRLPALRMRLDAAWAARGLRAVRLAGRFQVVGSRPPWILDVAHNEAAAAVLAANLRSLQVAGRTLAVAGILADKDIESIGSTLMSEIDGWILCTLDGPRALSAAELQRRLPSACIVLELSADVAAGCERARALARTEDRVVVFGSFHTVGPALAWLGIDQ
jgi:dihydrofolate synthase/folylpolyglutamate synthase